MAPIQGITSFQYRNEYSRAFRGYDCAITPFIKSVKSDSIKKSHLRNILPEKNDVTFEIIPQILGKTPKDFIVLARAIFDLGYKAVNWNLGCPLLRVRRKGRGSGMLPFSDEIADFLKEVIPAIPNKLSLKVRLGAEENRDLFKLLPELNDLPLKEIIIHPRTGRQMYSGEADVSSFEESLSLTKHPVVYNGDIDTIEKFEVLANRLPMINRWMIGRGGITDPFLPDKIKHLKINTEKKRLDRFASFHKALFEAYRQELSGPAHLIGKMKEVWWYWTRAFEADDKFFLKMTRIKDVDKYLLAVEKFFGGKPKLLV